MTLRHLAAGAAFLSLAYAASPSAAVVPVQPNLYRDDVKYLASKKLKGRGDGSPELETAAAFIERKFHSFGLRPGNGDSYQQAFEITTSSKLGPNNTLQTAAKTLAPVRDFLPFAFSGNGSVTAPVVAAGFGITAPEYHYDDYAGVDVQGKIVLIMRHEPQEFDDHSVFGGRVYTEHSQLFSKVSNAKVHGAKAVLIVSDIGNHSQDGDVLEKFGASAGPGNAGIPCVQITAAVADALLQSAGTSVRQMQESIDKDLKPKPVELAGTVTLRTELQREVRNVHNVLAYLPGETEEYVIVGAHYDHLGHGEQFSLAPNLVGTIHPGADDNASGTAGVIELARYFAQQQPKPKRGILFMTFAGEELGLLGSSYWVQHPTRDLKQAVAMINMDMIGRIRDGKVYVGGSKTGSSFDKVLADATAGSSLHMDMSEQAAYGSSDHTSFNSKQIPTLFFFSGLHADYHKPSDTWDKIDSQSASQLLAVVAKIVGELTSAPARPVFAKVEPAANPHGGGDVAVRGASNRSGYGPDFGSIPDFAEVPNGVRFADVRAGSPASKAGLKGGDILVEFDGKPVGNLYDFTYLLRSKNPGDEVVVRVLRNGQPLEVRVLLTARH